MKNVRKNKKKLGGNLGGKSEKKIGKFGEKSEKNQRKNNEIQVEKIDKK